MKKSLLVLMTIFFSWNLSNAQYSHEWAQWFNYSGESLDVAKSSTVDSAGNSYITGTTYNAISNYDIYTIKINSSGIKQWEVIYNGPLNSLDSPSEITVDKSGNVYITGSTYGGTSNFDWVTIKYNSSGIQQWVDIYNGTADSTDRASSVATDINGNVFVCGFGIKNGGGGSYNPDCITIKYNSNGSRQWVRSYELQLNSDDSCLAIKTDLIGNCYIAVRHYSNIIGLIKYNSAGSLGFIRNSSQYFTLKIFQDLEVDKIGNCFISYQLDSTGNHVYIKKYRSNGSLHWTNIIIDSYYFPNYFSFKTKTLDIDSTGNTHVLSKTQRGFVLTKYDVNGILNWNITNNILPPNINQVYPISLVTDNSSNVFVICYNYYLSTEGDFYTVKFNSSGIKQWYARYYNSQFPLSDDIPIGLGIDNFGNAFSSGYGVQLGSEYDYLVVKYQSSIQLNAKIIVQGFYDSTANSLRVKDTVTAYLRETTTPFQRIDSGKAVLDSLNFSEVFVLTTQNLEIIILN